MRKNVAGQVIGAQLVSATDGSAFTGSVTVAVTGDGGTQATGTVGSGACTHEGGGYHTYAPSQAETNYDLIAFTFSGTGAVPVTVQVFTRFDANVTHFGGTAGTFSGGRPEVNTTLVEGTDATDQIRDAAAAALVVHRLDELLNADSDIDGAAPPTVGSVFHELMSSTTGSFTYDQTTDSLEAIRDTGDASWATPIVPTAANIADAVWDEGYGDHQTNSTFGKIVTQTWSSIYAGGGTVDSTGATSSSFRTDIVANDDFYNDMLLTFTSGALAGQTRPITDFTATNGVFTFDEAFAAAPANGVTFALLRAHIHPISQIQSGLATSTELAKVPKSDGTVTWNATALASINAEADTALSDYGALKPTTAGRTLDVTATGAAGVDWSNVENPTTTVDLSGTTISTSQAVASVSGAVGSVTGAVGSVTGNVGGNVAGSVGSVTGNVGGNVTGSIGSLATQAKADVNAEADQALSDYGALKPTTAGRTLDVTATGAAGIDWGNVENPTTTLDLSSTTISTSQAVASVAGAVGSVTGAVGSVTGNVGGNVVGSVASVTNRVTANVDQIGGSAQSLTDLKDFADTGYDPATHKVQGVVLVDTTTTNSDMRGTDNAALAATALSTAVWTSTRAGYLDNLSAGAVAQASALTTVGNNVAAILEDTGTDGVVLSTTTLQSIADTLLARNVSNVEGSAPEHSLTTLVLAMLESSRSGTTWTIKRTDGSTTHATKTLTVDANADPITGVT